MGIGEAILGEIGKTLIGRAVSWGWSQMTHHPYLTLPGLTLALAALGYFYLRPPLLILYGTGSPYEARPEGKDRGKLVKQHLFRIGIYNRSSTPLEGITVQLTKTDPPVEKFYGLFLHLMTDNPNDPAEWEHPNNWHPAKEFDLGPGETKYVDVIYTDSRHPSIGRVFHIVGDVPKDLLPGRYVFFLTVHGKSFSPVRRQFEVEFRKGKNLRFKPVS